MKKPLWWLIALLVLCAAMWPFRHSIVPRVFAVARAVSGVKPKSVADRISQFGEAVRNRWQPDFQRAKVGYPPAKVTILGLKLENRVEVYAEGDDGTSRFIRSIPILAASGELGPKLREGDQQVPEGIYDIESLNPNSLFHVSLRVGYPNAFDRAKASQEGRQNLGGDIMIHGGAASVGCIAVGDEAAEDLFVLAHDVGLENIVVLVSPVDFRSQTFPDSVQGLPPWTNELYGEIRAAIAKLPKP